jgi:hypothetical protein
MLARTLTFLLLAASSLVDASLPLEASLRDLACGADHVFIGRVIGVDMIDSRGLVIRNPEARTGPGLTNTIRLEIEVLEKIDSTQPSLPRTIKVPLDSFMHYSLGQVKEVHSKPSEPALVFLRGGQFKPVIAGRFLWELDARGEALELRKSCRLGSAESVNVLTRSSGHTQSQCKPPEPMMEDRRFWALVAAVRAAAGNNLDARPAVLARVLGTLSLADLSAFQKRYESYLLLANRWDLRGAAYLMNGGSSDDGFKYFRDWLISEGQEIYQQALADPDSLSSAPSQEYFELEAYGYAAQKMYAAKGGGELDCDFNVELSTPTGIEWKDSDLPTMFPKLAARFQRK